jgi:hypothetical protein
MSLVIFFLVIKDLWRNEAGEFSLDQFGQLQRMLALPGARQREASHIIADQAHQSLTGVAAA